MCYFLRNYCICGKFFARAYMALTIWSDVGKNGIDRELGIHALGMQDVYITKSHLQLSAAPRVCFQGKLMMMMSNKTWYSKTSMLCILWGMTDDLQTMGLSHQAWLSKLQSLGDGMLDWFVSPN